MALGVALGLAFGLASHTVRAAPPEAGAPLKALAPGVYVREAPIADWGPSNQGRTSSQGVIVGKRCVAVVDTSGTPSDGRAFQAEVARLTTLPVCYVINTHAHPDHVLGNQAFARSGDGGPVFVGHNRLPAALQSRGPFYLNALKRDFGATEADARIVAPTQLVTGSLELDLGDRRLRLDAWPTAHTDADLTVLDETSGTLFLGDLLFVDHLPVLDGKLKGWLAAMKTVRDWKVTMAVPGHGASSRIWPGVLDPQERYLAGLQADTRRAIKDGATLAQAVERIAPDRPEWRLLDVFHKRNVTAAYAELEWDE